MSKPTGGLDDIYRFNLIDDNTILISMTDNGEKIVTVIPPVFSMCPKILYYIFANQLSRSISLIFE